MGTRDTPLRHRLNRVVCRGAEYESPGSVVIGANQSSDVSHLDKASRGRYEEGVLGGLVRDAPAAYQYSKGLVHEDVGRHKSDHVDCPNCERT